MWLFHQILLEAKTPRESNLAGNKNLFIANLIWSLLLQTCMVPLRQIVGK